jgi:hypothetical protein
MEMQNASWGMQGKKIMGSIVLAILRLLVPSGLPWEMQSKKSL